MTGTGDERAPICKYHQHDPDFDPFGLHNCHQQRNSDGISVLLHFDSESVVYRLAPWLPEGAPCLLEGAPCRLEDAPQQWLAT